MLGGLLLFLFFFQSASTTSWTRWSETGRLTWMTARTFRTPTPLSTRFRDSATSSPWPFCTKPRRTSPSRATSSKRSLPVVWGVKLVFMAGPHESDGTNISSFQICKNLNVFADFTYQNFILPNISISLKKKMSRAGIVKSNLPYENLLG